MCLDRFFIPPSITKPLCWYWIGKLSIYIFFMDNKVIIALWSMVVLIPACWSRISQAFIRRGSNIYTTCYPSNCKTSSIRIRNAEQFYQKAWWSNGIRDGKCQVGVSLWSTLHWLLLCCLLLFFCFILFFSFPCFLGGQGFCSNFGFNMCLTLLFDILSSTLLV